MARPSASDLPAQSPYQAPPHAMSLPVGPAPLSYAGQPLPPAPSAKAAPTPAGLFNAFRRRWVLSTLVGTLVAAVVASVIWFLLPAGKHEARALINLRDKNSDLTNKSNTEDYENYRRNQIFILRTRDLLTRTVNDPSVASLEMVRATDDPARLVEENLSISAAAPSILAVTLKGDNIEEMKTIVNEVVRRYIDDASANDRRELDAQTKKLERLETSLKDEVEALDRQIRMIARGTGVTGAEGSETAQTLIRLRIRELDNIVSSTNDELTRLESELKIGKQQLDTRKPTIEPAVLARAVTTDGRVVKLVLEREELLQLYEREKKLATDAATSPVVLELKEALDKADKAIEEKKKLLTGEIEAVVKATRLAAIQEEVGRLEHRIAVSREIRDRNRQDRDAIQKTLAGTAESHVEVAQLLKGLFPQREAIDKIRVQLVQLRMQKELDNRASVREDAQALPNNNLTKKLILSGGAGLGTFAVVILFISFLEWRTRRVDGVDQVVNELGMRIIGTVPAFPNRASLKAAAEAGGANWRFALNESINSTRTMLLHSARTQSMQVVMVTSATQGEGKTSIASQLGSSMATAGMRTLIVDCDLRNPSIHKLFDIGLSPGVSEILTQDIDVTDSIQPTAVPNLWVISAGQCSNRVVAALAQGHPLETLFNRLRGQFDFIVVDSCPVLPVADALLIGQHVDGVVFSIMQDVSQLPKVLLASEKLAQLNIPLLGAVVNGIKQDMYSYGYNYVKQLPA